MSRICALFFGLLFINAACAAPAILRNGLIVSNGLEVASGTLTVGGVPVLTESAPLSAGVVGTNELDAEVRDMLVDASTNSAAWRDLTNRVLAVESVSSAAGATGMAAFALAAAAYPANNPSGYLTRVNYSDATGMVQVVGTGSTGLLFVSSSPGAGFFGQMSSSGYTGTWSGAYGGEQRGFFSGATILGAPGARQIGQFSIGATRTAAVMAAGAEQRGFFATCNPTISPTAAGSSQVGSFNNPAGLSIGTAAHGAQQFGNLNSPNWASNNAQGAVQIMANGGNYLTPLGSIGSLLVGPGTAGPPYSVTAAGGFYGDGGGLTGVNARTVGNYLPTDFLLASTIPGILRQVTITPPTPTSPGTNGTWIATNGFFYLCSTNGWGNGTNWNRVAFAPW